MFGSIDSMEDKTQENAERKISYTLPRVQCKCCSRDTGCS